MDLKDSFEQFFRNIERDPKQGVQYSAGLLVFSLFLLFVVPNLVLKSYKNSTAESLQQVEALIQHAESRIPEQSWFSEDYSITSHGQSFQSDLAEAHVVLEESRSTFQNAGFGWPAKRVRLYQQAQVEVFEAKAFVDVTIALFDHNVALREQVAADLQSGSVLLDSTFASQLVAYRRFSSEEDEWLTTYMSPLESSLGSAEEKLITAENHMNTADSYMPDWSDLSHRGNPLAAEEQIDRAKILIDEIVSLQRQVTSGLDYQIEARNGAPGKANEAELAITAAHRRLVEIDAQYKWGFNGALAEANNFVKLADSSLLEAHNLLVAVVPVEEKIDWPAAYEAGKRALSQAQQSVVSANQQVSAYVETNNLLARYTNIHSTAIADIRVAESAWSTIERYHHSSTWSSKQNNIAGAWQLVGLAESAYANTSQSLSNQEFLIAQAQMGGSISNLQEASNLSKQVVSLMNALEGYRSSWPGKRDRAQSEISSNRARVNSYGSYSSSARSDFNSAVSLMSDAESAASQHKYELAGILADQAYNEAEGTGARAERAYDDEMDRQRRAAEEAARQAEEAARRAAESSSSSSSGSSYDGGYNDGGGFNSGGSSSGGGYNDGGGYDGGGSSYDDGGGY